MEERSERPACFSPDKHKLLKVIEQENDSCEIKWFEKTESNDILITDYTTIKRMKLDFMQPIYNAVFQKNSMGGNKLPLFDMINVKGKVCNIEVLETVSKDNKLLKFKKGSLKNKIDSMLLKLNLILLLDHLRLT